MKDRVVSVVIPAQKDCVSLGQCLEAVMRQSFSNKEIIIACDPRAADRQVLPPGSEDVRIIRERNPSGLSHLVNAGMRAARGHFKILLLPQCIPIGERWIQQMVKPFDDEGVGVVVGGCSPFPDGRPGLGVRLMESLSPRHRSGRRADSAGRQLVSHRCDAYRASLLADIGYFSEELPGPGAAVEASLRVADAGYRIVAGESARARYRPGRHDHLGGVLQRAFVYGRSDGLLERHGDLRWLNCGIFAAALFSALLPLVALLNLPVAVLLGLALFVWGWFLSLRVPLVRWEFPVAVLNGAIFVAIVLVVRDGWRPATFGTQVHPAILRQWFWVVSVVCCYGLLVARAAFESALRTCLQPHGLLYAVPVALTSVAWWLAAGVGYLRGAFVDSIASR